jgi:hypothetical protein
MLMLKKNLDSEDSQPFQVICGEISKFLENFNKLCNQIHKTQPKTSMWAFSSVETFKRFSSRLSTGSHIVVATGAVKNKNTVLPLAESLTARKLSKLMEMSRTIQRSGEQSDKKSESEKIADKTIFCRREHERKSLQKALGELWKRQ